MKCENCGKQIPRTGKQWLPEYRDAMIAIHAQNCLPPSNIPYARQVEMFNELKTLVEERKRKSEQDRQ